MIDSRVDQRYVIEEEIASGGMGVVYRVRDRSTGDSLALKRLTARSAQRKDLVEAFEREYRVLAGLDHPRIIRVFDYGVDGVGPYYTMELLAGKDMRRAAPLPYREACRYLRDVATSLALLHARRLLHRDLSPSNVRMTPEGRCKLIDFGALATFGVSEVVVGTPPVVPPETLLGNPLDQRSDLYSLGALAYWMLTGRHAYPARQFDQLLSLWERTPQAPSALVPDIPKGLDELVLSLLRRDAHMRPTSATEVISRLNLLADLEPTGAEDDARLTESFLQTPRFVGRTAALERAQERIEGLMRGRGGALRIEGAVGTGRSRLLEEIGLRAQVAGAGVVHVDASLARDWNGVARALVLGVLEVLPQLSRDLSGKHAVALAGLGKEVERELASIGSIPPPDPRSVNDATQGRLSAEGTPRANGSVDGWLIEISRGKPLVLAVDNVDEADDRSLGLLVALARAAPHCPLLLVTTETRRAQTRDAAGLVSLRNASQAVALKGMVAAETLELCRSIFGDAPNLERFAEWLHEFTAGSPSYIVEVSRGLVADGALRCIDGAWLLPADVPNADLPQDLEHALLSRLAGLSEPARNLAESLCLEREQPTMPLLRLLLGDDDERHLLRVLDELVRSDVLHSDRGVYRFGSTAVREALLSDLDRTRHQEAHRRLGNALAALAASESQALQIEAGFHLIRGGEDQRGADLIASVTHDAVALQGLIVNLHHVGRPVEAALKVYRRHRRSVYERAPLVAALAVASYAEDYKWGDVYGDEALDACEDLSGVRTARALRPVFGRWLSMAIGLIVAFIRFRLTPRRQRGYAFRDMLVMLFGAATALTGTAALLLDVERATRVVETLDLFATLPRRLAPVGIYEFCMGLPEIGRERQSETFRSFGKLIQNFSDPHHYRGLPEGTRIIYMTGSHFVRAIFATMRADGAVALESADALEASGLRMYAMIACQLRFLYHTYRGELAAAAVHREQAEVHAAHLGSGWQGWIWEPAALIPVASKLRDVVALTRIADRLEQSSETVQSLDLYRKLAGLALWRARGGYLGDQPLALTIAESYEPRSFIGWAHSFAVLARSENDAGNYADAKALCEQVLEHITDDDREFVALFIDVDIEMANALAGMGEVETALARLDALIERFEGCNHPLLHGSLYEARARIAWNAGRLDEYLHDLAVVDRWFRATTTPSLIARVELLADLQTASTTSASPSKGESGAAASSTTHTVTSPARSRLSRRTDSDFPTEATPVRRRDNN